ncbi:glutathione s-transferase [Aspergillus sp. HF37]|nr:glutathione s-transferase [Aspergillus sp. HF37]
MKNGWIRPVVGQPRQRRRQCEAVGSYYRCSYSAISAISRYKDEVRRVTGMLEMVLAGREWLVGDKCTYADLAFVPWQDILGLIMGEEAEREVVAEFPNVRAWMERMKARPEARRVLRMEWEAMEEMMLTG